MSQACLPPVAIKLGRPVALRWLDDLVHALRAWHARWVAERQLVDRERALRHLDRRVLKDLGLPEPGAERPWSGFGHDLARW